MTPSGPPSDNPKSAARSEPAASITARTSSMRSSNEAGAATGSDRPVPRLSNRISRENEVSFSRKRAIRGSAH